MEIDFNKLKKKEYPEYLEKYYSNIKLSEDVLSETNLKYVYDKEKDVLNLAQGKEVLFKFKKKINFPEDVKSSDDIDQFLFNSQTVISLDYDKSVAVIEDVEIPLEDLFLNLSGESGQFEYVISPSNFDKKDIIKRTLQFDNNQKDIDLVRVANSESAYTKKYEYNSHPLKITVYLTKSNEISISVSTQFDGDTILELLLESLNIQIAFLKKDLHINGVPLYKMDSDNKSGNEEKLIRMNESFNFWKNVSRLQEKLNLQFNIKFPLDDETMQTLEKLIISFVFEKVYRETYKINTINLKFKNIEEMHNNIEEIKINDSSAVHWRESHEICILGVTTNIYQYFGVSNFHVNSIKTDDETISVKLIIKEKNDEKMVVVSKFMLENEVIENVLKSNIPKYWVEFRDKIKSRD